MAVSSNSPAPREAAVTAISDSTPKTNGLETNTATTPPKTSIDTSGAYDLKNTDGVDNTAEFEGDVNTNNEIPSQEVLRRVEDMNLLDQDGKTIPFKHLYSGPNVARRVMIIFIRHFFCGNCQEYIRSITSSITTADLLQLPTPTFIAVVGCGSPSLISMYKKETSCPFPVYADPTKKLYDELGMLRTLNPGARPEYMRKSMMSAMAGSFVQSLKMIKGGKAFQGGDYQQVGGEFLFEPVNAATPICSPDVSNGDNENKKLGEVSNGNLGSGEYEEKRITWCHRMRNTRDHAEIPELREVLGLDGHGVPGQNRKRWTRALGARKGTGLSTRSSVSMTRNGSGSGRQSSEKPMDGSNIVR